VISTVGLSITDSATQVGASARGTVVICGSHAGTFAAACVARWGVRGVILNDAGVGLDAAGVAGLLLLEELGIPGAAVSHDSARIGVGQDTWDTGVLSHVNRNAADLGCREGMSVPDAADRMWLSRIVDADPADMSESRSRVAAAPLPVWVLDSASLVRPEDAGSIVLTGSHGGLLGGRRETALKVDALAAVFNDAGGGRDGAGTSRLPALDARGIAAATVASNTARIGDGRSTYDDGVLSAVNCRARALGAKPGMTAREFVDLYMRN
jgi:uncharacterized protein YunC (DUF1805 family)